MGNSTYPFDIKTHTCTKIHLVIKMHTLKIAPQKTVQNIWYKTPKLFPQFLTVVLRPN